MVKLAVILLAAGLLLSGCKDEDNNVDKGTVKYISLEGGFYGIISEGGKHYDPVNLKDEFKVDGLKVEFEYKKADNQTSVHMWGELIEIINIKKIE